MEKFPENTPFLRAELIIHDAHVVTMDPDYHTYTCGAVAVANGMILAVGDSRDVLRRYTADRMIDGRKKLLIPGLVNSHTHSPMTIFRGYADDIPLKQWLYDQIFPVESAFAGPGNVRLGTRLAISEMIRSGTTTFNDMYYHIDDMAAVVEGSGMRAVLTESLIDFPAPNSPTPAHSLRFSEEMIQEYRNHPLITIGVSVHSVYSASPVIYREARELADKYALPFSTHLAETRWEFDLIMEKYGVTPTRYLDDMGVMDKRTVLAHAVHLTGADMELIARRGAGVAHNPQCNMKLASGVAPIPRLLEMGVAVGIGTDGVASNNDLDMFDEMRTCAFSHKMNLNDPTVMDARTVLEAATMGGARLLGMNGLIGSLEPGKRADLVMLDLNRPHAHPVFNIYSLIVYSLRGGDVHSVMVDGRLLMEDGKMLTVDEADLFDQVEALAGEITAHRSDLAARRLSQSG
jgi:5-methylthioadenosine/S-adenosylhomocysteine deaminase